MYTAEIWTENYDGTIAKEFYNSDSLRDANKYARHRIRHDISEYSAWTVGAEIRKADSLLFSVYETAMDPTKYTRESIF